MYTFDEQPTSLYPTLPPLESSVEDNIHTEVEIVQIAVPTKGRKFLKIDPLVSLERLSWIGIIFDFLLLFSCINFDFTGIHILWLQLFVIPIIHIIVCTCLLIGKWFKFWPVYFPCILINLITTFCLFFGFMYFFFFAINSWGYSVIDKSPSPAKLFMITGMHFVGIIFLTTQTCITYVSINVLRGSPKSDKNRV